MSTIITNERTPLISAEDFRNLARPVSTHVDEEEIDQFIREGEDVFIIPAIGWAVFKAVTQTMDWSGIFGDDFLRHVLVDGGEYTVSTCGCDTAAGEYYCNGLKKALAYWVYAKMQRNDGNIIARAGAMQHNDQYASHTNDTTLKRYNDTMSIAEKYLGECLQYINANQDDKTYTARQSRVRIIAVGD